MTTFKYEIRNKMTPKIFSCMQCFKLPKAQRTEHRQWILMRRRALRSAHLYSSSKELSVIGGAEDSYTHPWKYMKSGHLYIYGHWTPEKVRRNWGPKMEARVYSLKMGFCNITLSMITKCVDQRGTWTGISAEFTQRNLLHLICSTSDFCCFRGKFHIDDFIWLKFE